MKLKRIFKISLLLLAVLMISAVSAAENNMTADAVQLENNQNAEIEIKENNGDLLSQDDDEAIGVNENFESETVLSSPNNSDKLEVSSDNVVLKKSISEKPLTSSKQKTYVATMKIKVSNHWYNSKILKTGDELLIAATSRYGQHGKGVTIGTMIDAGQEGQHSTKLIKAKVWFKNTKTGKIKIITKSAKSNGYNIKKFNWMKNYKPYKAKIWYKFR